jgi:phenylacetate-CoA ligase
MRVRDIFFLLHLQQNQWHSPQHLQRLQNRRLRRLIRHAYDRVPYYRRLFDSVGLQPQQISCAEDLARLPVTSRDDMRGLPPEDLVARGLDLGHCRKSMTSGSTGIPRTILHSRHDLTRMNLAWLRVYLAHGVKPWHRMAVFTGERDVPQERPWYERWGLLPRKLLSTWDDPRHWLAELGTWRPQALTGYVMTLKLLASAMQSEGVTPFRPHVVFQSSGLLDRSSRQFLHAIFGAKIIDIYGSAEAGCIAWECDVCSAYHVNSDMVVITNLYSFTMPFIRYRQGDVGRWSEQPPQCGRGFPLMGVVEGRLGDFITLPSGKKLSPHHFFIALDTAVGVARWQLVQETAHRLRAEVVVNARSGNAACQAAHANLQAIVGEEMEIAVTEVPSLAYDPARKFRSVVSMLPEDSPA